MSRPRYGRVSERLSGRVRSLLLIARQYCYPNNLKAVRTNPSIGRMTPWE